MKSIAMKNSIVSIILLFVLGEMHAQNFEIPSITWQHTDSAVNFHVDFLKLKDADALIVKIGYSSYWTKGQNSEFIVYQNDGKVLRFLVYQPNSPELKTKIKRKRIKKKRYKYYWAYLQACIRTHKINIDTSKLNITSRKGKEEGTQESMHVSDGANYFLQICQGKNYITYQSYSPESYIRAKYPGYEERQKLVDLMNGFEELSVKR